MWPNVMRGSARNAITAVSVMRGGGRHKGIAPGLPTGADPVRRIVFQGDTDRTVHPSNAAMIVAAAVGDAAVPRRTSNRSVRGRGYARSEFAGADGAIVLELWMIEGAGHAWSGGRAAGSFTDVKGPCATAEMMRFFLAKSA